MDQNIRQVNTEIFDVEEEQQSHFTLEANKSFGTISTTDTSTEINSVWRDNAVNETRRFEEMLETERNREIRFSLSKPYKEEPIPSNKSNKVLPLIILMLFLSVIGLVFFILLFEVENGVDSGEVNEDEVENENEDEGEGENPPFISTDVNEIGEICDNFRLSEFANTEFAFPIQYFVCTDQKNFVLCEIDAGSFDVNCELDQVCPCRAGDFIDTRSLTAGAAGNVCVPPGEQSQKCQIKLDDDNSFDLRTFLNA